MPDWTTELTFNIDGSGDGKYCKYPDTTGKKRIFESKTAGNVNHTPPSDPGITENTYWKEVSASGSAAIPEWTAGVFGPGLIIVFHNHSTDGRGLYVLLEAVRPYNSSNIETEITAGKWQRMGGDGTALWGELTGTLTAQSDLVAYIAAQISAATIAWGGLTGTLTSQTDLVTYIAVQINAALEGLKWKSPGVRARTTAALPANTASGGNTVLTANSNGALAAQDGATLSVNQDLLVANEATQSKNGIYKVTQVGDGSTPWILTRRSDTNTAGELEGAVVSVEEGTLNANTTWRQTTDSVTLGSSNIVWISFGVSAPPADESTPGLAEILTQGESDTGTDDSRILTIKKLRERDGAVAALTDSSTTNITSDKWTWSTSAASRTVTFGFTGDFSEGVITLSNTALSLTLPAACLCVTQGIASGDNTSVVSPAISGDKIYVGIKKYGSLYLVVIFNLGQ